MKTDWYLKGVLTVIAIALTLNVLNDLNLLPTAKASEKPTFVSPNALPVNPDGSITIRMPEGERLDVNVAAVGGNSFYEQQLPVDIRTVDGTPVFGGRVPVQVNK
ncbi:MAG: hypothetical protein ACOCZ8_02915 [Bacteroidota bacterium]